MSYSHTTTHQQYVVSSQPVSTTVVTKQVITERPWTTELCSCFEDMGVCLCTTFCTPCFACIIAKNMGENCCYPMCAPGGMMTIRSVVRTRNHIQGSLCNDCCIALYCGHCSMCQVARELKATGQWQS